MKSWKDLKKELLENKEVAREYKNLEPRYLIISKLIEARNKMGLTQKDVAEKIGTRQSAIARFESGLANPTLSFLEKLTTAINAKIIIRVN